MDSVSNMKVDKSVERAYKMIEAYSSTVEDFDGKEEYWLWLYRKYGNEMVDYLDAFRVKEKLVSASPLDVVASLMDRIDRKNRKVAEKVYVASGSSVSRDSRELEYWEVDEESERENRDLVDWLSKRS